MFDPIATAPGSDTPPTARRFVWQTRLGSSTVEWNRERRAYLSLLTKDQERVTIMGARTNRWTRAEPAGLLSTTCGQRSCVRPRQLNRYRAANSIAKTLVELRLEWFRF